MKKEIKLALSEELLPYQTSKDTIVEHWEAFHPYFTKEEFNCKHTGLNQMRLHFMNSLYRIRHDVQIPFIITSGYRDESHPVESNKGVPGEHTRGVACDISCHSDQAYLIVQAAIKAGFTGIGISQKVGLTRFVHLDMRTSTPRIYSY